MAPSERPCRLRWYCVKGRCWDSASLERVTCPARSWERTRRCAARLPQRLRRRRRHELHDQPALFDRLAVHAGGLRPGAAKPQRADPCRPGDSRRRIVGRSRPHIFSDEAHRIAFGFSPPDDPNFATRLRDGLGERGRTRRRSRTERQQRAWQEEVGFRTWSQSIGISGRNQPVRPRGRSLWQLHAESATI